MRRLATIGCVLTLCCSMASAGPLKVEQVAGDAQWVAHVDVAVLLKSGIAKFILEEAEKKQDFLEGISKFRETFGFDPLKDIRGLTLYGKKLGDDKAVLVMDATMDQQKIVALLKSNDTYKEHEYGDYTIHQWTDPPKPAKEPGAPPKPAKTNYGAFYDAKTILVGGTIDLLKGAIDAMKDKGKSLAKSDALKILPKPAAGVFALAAAEGIKLPPNAKPDKAALLRNVRDVTLQIGEKEGDTFLSLTALTATPERALKLRQVIQGFVALGQMMLAEQENLPALGEKVQVTGQENVVQVNAAVPTESLVKMILFLAERKKKKAAEARRDLLRSRRERANNVE